MACSRVNRSQGVVPEAGDFIVPDTCSIDRRVVATLTWWRWDRQGVPPGRGARRTIRRIC